jgi:hypothetical protein
MNVSRACAVPRDSGYVNACAICGAPSDSNYFDVSSFKAAPASVGQEVELARHALHSQYCGALLYFAQYAERAGDAQQVIAETPGYEWIILCNNQPRAPYLPTRLILSPWGFNAFPVNLRLEEGCVLQFVVRRVAPPPGTKEIALSQVGGRLMGRSWYNADYGGAPAPL